MVGALKNEIEIQQHYLEGEEISTIYFGGGTPSLLTIQQIELLLNTISRNFKINPESEITLEANPDDLSITHLNALYQSGINRLSIGVQSFDDHVLKYLNRAHNAALALRCIHNAQDAGFENISIDLIYSIPNQDHDKWRQNILQAIALHPPHISSYSLTIEEKTAFGKWYKSGKLKPAEDDFAAEQLELLRTTLEEKGYEQYEVSNFAKPGFYSRHNSSYWRQEKYLGIGPSAHSYNRVSRQFNVKQNHLYLKALKSGFVPFDKEVLTRQDQINDYLLTTLRTAWGSDLIKIKEEFQYDLLKENSHYISDIVEKNLAILTERNLILTAKGKLFADKISSDLFVLK